MGCKAEVGSRELCMSEDSCVICRGDMCTQRMVKVPGGAAYEKCTPFTWVDPVACDGLVKLMEDPCDLIVGVLMCDEDFTETPAEEMCDVKLLCNAVFDTNMIKWPTDADGAYLFTVEDLENIQSRSDKPCFRTRVGCIELPGWLSGKGEK